MLKLQSVALTKIMVAHRDFAKLTVNPNIRIIFLVLSVYLLQA
jgi:hypothetical protein